MKEIALTQGKVALVDDDYYERAKNFIWHAENDCGRWYASRTVGLRPNRYSVKMHRDVISAPDGVKVDHKNRNGLDNRKENLRLATDLQNAVNCAPSKHNTSGYKGVTWIKRDKVWRAQIKVNGKKTHIGHFQNKEDAAMAYDEQAYKLFGDFAYLNFPDRCTRGRAFAALKGE